MLSTTEIDELRKSVLSFIEFYDKVLLFEYENDIDVLTDDDKLKYENITYMNDDLFEYLPNKYDVSSDTPLINKINSYPKQDIPCYNLIWNQQVECFYYKWFDKPKPMSFKSFYFYTYTGQKKIPLGENNENIFKMKEICDKMFNNDTWKRYLKVNWCIETGKNNNNYNLHLHAVIVFNGKLKHYDRDFTRTWNKYFKEYGINYSGDGKQHYSGKGLKFYQDKLDYLDETLKSDLHQNALNLNLMGSLG